MRGTLVCGVIGEDDRSARAEMLARIAAEEAADLILIGSRRPGRFRRRLRDTVAADLVSQTPVPVVIAPPARGERHRQHAPPGRGLIDRVG